MGYSQSIVNYIRANTNYEVIAFCGPIRYTTIRSSFMLQFDLDGVVSFLEELA